MKTPEVDILLATYNGERFVREQIESLRAQTFRNWRLLVHDDGSTDCTLDIVRNLAIGDPRIEILSDGVRFGKAPANFLYLLRFSDAPRVMFCDQDDVWFLEKVEKMLAASRSLADDTPGVVYSRANYWNPERGVINQTWRRYPVGLPMFLTQKAAVQGSASMFNGAMRDALLSYQGPVVMHDHLVGLVANSFGEAVYMPDVLMNYRQHDRNVTGNNDEARTGLAWIWRKLSNRPVMDPLTLRSIRSFYGFFEPRISPGRKKIYEEFFRLENRSRIGRVLAARRYGFGRDGSVNKLSLKLLLSPYLNN